MLVPKTDSADGAATFIELFPDGATASRMTVHS